MQIISKVAVATLVLAAGLTLSSASMAGPLKNLVNAVNDTVNTVVDTTETVVNGTLDTLTGGDSDLTGDVSLGDGNTIAGAKAGAGGTTATASVTGGNGQGGLLNSGGLLGTGLLDGDDDGGLLGSGILGSNLTVGLNLAGLQLDLTVPGIDELLGGGGGGGGGNPGTGGGGGGNGAGGNGGGKGVVRVGSLSDYTVKCSVDQGRQVLDIAAKAKFSARVASDWRRATGVQIIPVKLCPSAKTQVTQIFSASGKIHMLQQAVAGDMLIMASLQRAGRDAGDVFAVQRKGSQLIVYVL